MEERLDAAAERDAEAEERQRPAPPTPGQLAPPIAHADPPACLGGHPRGRRRRRNRERRGRVCGGRQHRCGRCGRGAGRGARGRTSYGCGGGAVSAGTANSGRNRPGGVGVVVTASGAPCVAETRTRTVSAGKTSSTRSTRRITTPSHWCCSPQPLLSIEGPSCRDRQALG